MALELQYTAVLSYVTSISSTLLCFPCVFAFLHYMSRVRMQYTLYYILIYCTTAKVTMLVTFYHTCMHRCCKSFCFL